MIMKRKHQYQWDISKTGITGKFIVLNSYIKKMILQLKINKQGEINDLSFYVKKAEKSK